MSDSTDSTPTPESTPKPADESKESSLPAAVRLQKDVKAAVADREKSDGSARQRVINALEEQEMARRTDILSEALKKRRDHYGDLKKMDKPDVITVGPDGTETKSYTGGKTGLYGAVKKQRDNLARLDALIDGVIDQPSPDSYEKLSKYKKK